MSEAVSDADANRAVSLALRVGELLLANGEGTERVTATMPAITRAYGLRRIEADVNPVGADAVARSGRRPPAGHR
ncbi:threonine/serine exporter family protein [Nonomuraea sp. NPDC052265]|uniref:threonine/serine exporter family protein n=1 Tax=Nonomuraea sp. NPDC052265 TaxID=3364374 RepID=UPI0037C4F106